MSVNTEELFSFDRRINIDTNLIVGVDEAGRGPLAGPVVCACVVMPLEKDKLIVGINDSKKLSAKKRELLYNKIKEVAIAYSIVEIDNETIDKVNILNATKIGMRKAINNVQQQLNSINKFIDVVLIDAVKLDDIDLPQKNLIKGDAKSYSIASASILAKVYRDNLMENYAKQYPQYCFEKHKGYGTKVHIENLKKYGKCNIHRDSFIKNFIK